MIYISERRDEDGDYALFGEKYYSFDVLALARGIQSERVDSPSYQLHIKRYGKVLVLPEDVLF